MVHHLLAMILLGVVPIPPERPAQPLPAEPTKPAAGAEKALVMGPAPEQPQATGPDPAALLLGLADRVDLSVVLVRSIHQRGVGFLFQDSRHVVTSYRLIAHGRALSIETKGGQRVAASLLAWDAADDVAILRLAQEAPGGQPLGPAPVAPAAGDPVALVIGYPGEPGPGPGALDRAVRSRALMIVRIAERGPRTTRMDRGLSPLLRAGPILDAEGKILAFAPRAQARPGADASGPALAVSAARLTALIQSAPPGETGKAEPGGLALVGGAGLGGAFGQGPGAWALTAFFGGLIRDRLEAALRFGYARSDRLGRGFGGGFPEQGATVSWAQISLEGAYQLYLGEFLNGLSFARLALGASWVHRTTEERGYVLSADQAGVEVLREGERRSVGYALLPLVSVGWLWSVYELRYGFTPDFRNEGWNRHSVELLWRWGER